MVRCARLNEPVESWEYRAGHSPSKFTPYGRPPVWLTARLTRFAFGGVTDTAVNFIVQHGGSVRLVGDDQQLAAIGAGGVLRDIQASHGAVRLTELHRFADPAEAAATLALRDDDRPEALGFYLDRQRVQVGNPTTTIDAASTPGRTTAATALTRSRWHRPGSWSTRSTNAPATIASQAPLRGWRSSQRTATSAASAT